MLTERELTKVVESAGLRPPLFVKPTASYGSREVVKVAELRDVGRIATGVARRNPELRRLMIEEGVPGDEWHLDGVLCEGELREFCVSRYLTPPVETKLGNPMASIAFPPAKHGELYQAARSLALQAVKALGHQRGVFHFEAFSEPGTFQFVAGELAARPGGNASPEIVVRTIGVDPWEAAGLTLTGDELPRYPVALPAKTYGMLSLPASGGRPNLVKASHLANLPGVREVSCMLPYGAPMPDMLETSAACIGVALIEANDFAECQLAMERVIAQVHALNSPLEPARLHIA